MTRHECRKSWAVASRALLFATAALALFLGWAEGARAATTFGLTPADDWQDGFINSVFVPNTFSGETSSIDTFPSQGGSGGPATMTAKLESTPTIGHSYIPTGAIQTPNRVTPGFIGGQTNLLTLTWGGGTVEQLVVTLFDFDPGENLSAFSVQPDSVTGGTLSGGVFQGNANNANSVLTWNNLNAPTVSFVTNSGPNAQIDTIDWTATNPGPAVLDITDFNAASPGPEMPLTDGRQPGFGTPLGASGVGDTMAGWTWYTQDSAVNTISVPFGGGSATVGEQVIRNGTNFEIDSAAPTSFFNLRWGTTSALALRKTFAVGPGTANVDWVESLNLSGGLFGYYSQDGGSTWASLLDGVDFSVTDGSLDVLFVANDGVDTRPGGANGGLRQVVVGFPSAVIPEPSALLVWSLLAGLWIGCGGRRRKR